MSVGSAEPGFIGVGSGRREGRIIREEKASYECSNRKCRN